MELSLAWLGFVSSDEITTQIAEVPRPKPKPNTAHLKSVTNSCHPPDNLYSPLLCSLSVCLPSDCCEGKSLARDPWHRKRADKEHMSSSELFVEEGPNNCDYLSTWNGSQSKLTGEVSGVELIRGCAI